MADGAAHLFFVTLASLSACETLEARACLGLRNNQFKITELSGGKKVLCMILAFVFNIQVVLDNYRLYNL